MHEENVDECNIWKMSTLYYTESIPTFFKDLDYIIICIQLTP